MLMLSKGFKSTVSCYQLTLAFFRNFYFPVCFMGECFQFSFKNVMLFVTKPTIYMTVILLFFYILYLFSQRGSIRIAPESNSLPTVWTPTAEWVSSWRAKLPLQTIMRLLQVLVPQVEKICIDK